VGLRIELQCDACGETAQVAVTNNPSPTPEDFAQEEAETGRGFLDDLETHGWRLKVVKGIVVAACCPEHWDEAARRLKGELAVRGAVREVMKPPPRPLCPHCGKTTLDLSSCCPHCGGAV
jgi:hypothetical protein